VLHSLGNLNSMSGRVRLCRDAGNDITVGLMTTSSCLVLGRRDGARLTARREAEEPTFQGDGADRRRVSANLVAATSIRATWQLDLVGVLVVLGASASAKGRRRSPERPPGPWNAECLSQAAWKLDSTSC
jgi:hypothetical protein